MPPEQNPPYGRLSQLGVDYAPQQNLQAGIAPPMPENHIRQILIRQLNHGYIVEAGCQVIAIESASKLITLFAEYVNNPMATEAKHTAGKLL